MLKSLNSKPGDLATIFISVDGQPMRARRECSYVNVVNSESPKKKVNFRTLVNDECVEDTDFVLPLDTIAKKVTRDDDGFFYFKFASLTGLEQVIEQGPWLIRNTPIILNKWTPNLSLTKDEVTRVPVWVKMHKVLVVAYSEDGLSDGLSLIATQIGKPIMLDAFTSSMCVDSWGRIGFARALIEVSANKELKQEIIMAVPVEEGTGHTKERIRLEYEWKPPLCIECHVFGHATDQCPKRVIEQVTVSKDNNDDGFTTVTNKKKKGKKTEKVQPRNIEGIKLNKPKSSFVYRPLNSQPSTAKPSTETPLKVETKNPFDTLWDQDDVPREAQVGESSRGKNDDYMFEVHDPINEDVDSEVEEV
ncbi:trichome birefringence-like protein 3, partial [Tanacetum coccineum]